MEILVTLITVAVMLYVLVKELYDPLKVFSLVLVLFLTLGYISVDEAVAGFSNKGVLTVAILFVIASAVERSSAFQKVTQFNDLNGSNFKPVKLFSIITVLSAFLNNTPIVSIFIPITKKISKKTGISSSKLLIPLSYLSILGGLLTLIGTSTNLVVSGLMEEYGLQGIGFFELTRITLPAVLVCFLYVLITYKKRLPDYPEVLDTSYSQQNEHFIRFIVKKESSIVGKTIVDANLRALKGVYLIGIERDNKRIFPVTPDEIVSTGDLLIFAGQTDQIDELRLIDHLVLETDHEFDTNYFNYDHTLLIEAVVTQPLGKHNQTIKEMKFRERYHSVVIGVIRNGERIQEKLGSVKPKLGDILLLIIDKGVFQEIYSSPNLSVIASEERKDTKHNKKGLFPVLAFVMTICFTVLGLNILHSALIGVGFLLVTNTIQVKESLASIEYKTIILIAISFSVGKALTNTGTAAFLASGLVPLIDTLNPLFLLMITFVLTNFFTSVITNNAAAVLSVPIVYELASQTSYDIRPFLLVTAIAASTAFLSPYGYQTNTMVYGAGGYKFSDFVKFGYPMTLIMLFMSTYMTYLLYFV